MKNAIVFMLLVASVVVFAVSAKEGVCKYTFGQVRNKAMSGDVNEQYRLGQMYRLGKLVSEDREKAMKWFKIASLNGDALSERILNRMESGEM